MNTIGIDHNLDRPRIRKLLTIGLLASILTGIGDFLLGYAENTAGSSLATSVMAMMLISCVAFIQDNKFFGSAPKEAREVIIQKEHELFYGARAIGWTLFIISVLMILGVGVIAVWDGFRSGFTFWQFFLRFVLIFTIYKICDMVLIDNFLLLKFHFFQYYYPEAAHVMEGRKYGFNIVSQLLKLFVIFPAVSALAAWICTLF